MSKRHILFVGGGTAGHIAPLLAVMAAVQTMDSEVKCSYVGQESDLSSALIKGSPLSFSKHAISAGKMHRFLTLDQIRQTKQLLSGLKEAKALVTRLKPDVIFAKGGYVTIPIVAAAWRLRIPVYAHESDVVAGLANRFVMRVAKQVFTAWPTSAYKKVPTAKLRYTGQPVRSEFYKAFSGWLEVEGRKIKPDVPTITVIGGSQGARRINQLVSGAWEKLLPRMNIVHITGPKEVAEYEKLRKSLTKEMQERLFVTGFLTEELPALFQKSAVVVSRAGGSVAEMAACRACVLLVPLSTAAQNHQWANARVLEEAGAAVTLDETVATSADLIEKIETIMRDTSEQTMLRAALGSFDRPNAAEVMAKELLAS